MTVCVRTKTGNGSDTDSLEQRMLLEVGGVGVGGKREAMMANIPPVKESKQAKK